MAALAADGSLALAGILVALSTVAATAAALRFGAEVPFDQFAFGSGRSPAIGALLELIGPGRTAIVVYLLERSWSALIVAGALGPLLIWLLGASALHAAARLFGFRRPFLPTLVVFGTGVGVARLPAEAAAAIGGPRDLGATAAQVVGLAALAWLGVVAWRTLAELYGMPGQRAFTALAMAVALFYLAPLGMVVVAGVAILVAAIILDVVPGG
ncbi:MAG: hypothetical protein ABR525_07915 [Candidatus Limnocylindria bacterium]